MDPISNMIVAIKNAGDAGHTQVLVPHSRIKEDIASVLKGAGFVSEQKKVMKRGRPHLEITLAFEDKKPKISGVKRLSKTSKRVYKKAGELRPVRSGYGLLVLTTPKGVMSGSEARKQKLGGEVLFSIW